MCTIKHILQEHRHTYTHNTPYTNFYIIIFSNYVNFIVFFIFTTYFFSQGIYSIHIYTPRYDVHITKCMHTHILILYIYEPVSYLHFTPHHLVGQPYVHRLHHHHQRLYCHFHDLHCIRSAIQHMHHDYFAALIQ